MGSGSTPALEFSKVWKTYGEEGTNAVHALKSFSTSISEGELVVIRGPSGSGKSTLLSLAGCLDAQSSGEVRVFGNDLAPGDIAKRSRLRREFIGFVFQNYKLLPALSAFENVVRPLLIRGISSRKRNAIATRQLERLGLGEVSHRRPAELSGGQQQRVAIARCLAASPRLIIADEPTGALDSENALMTVEILSSLKDEGITIIMGTHDDRMANHASRSITLLDGELEENGRASINAIY